MRTSPDKPLIHEAQNGLQKMHKALDKAEADLAKVNDNNTPFEERRKILEQYVDIMTKTRISWQGVPEEEVLRLVDHAVRHDPDCEAVLKRDDIVSRQWLELFCVQLDRGEDLQGQVSQMRAVLDKVYKTRTALTVRITTARTLEPDDQLVLEEVITDFGFRKGVSISINESSMEAHGLTRTQIDIDEIRAELEFIFPRAEIEIASRVEIFQEDEGGVPEDIQDYIDSLRILKNLSEQEITELVNFEYHVELSSIDAQIRRYYLRIKSYHPKKAEEMLDEINPILQKGVSSLDDLKALCYALNNHISGFSITIEGWSHSIIDGEFRVN